MEANVGSPNSIVAKLIDMGFETSRVMEAIEVVGSSLNDIVDHLLNKYSTSSKGDSTHSSSSTMLKNAKLSRKRSHSSIGNMRQSSILELLQPMGKSKKRQAVDLPEETTSTAELQRHIEAHEEMDKPHNQENLVLSHTFESSETLYSLDSVQKAKVDVELGQDWETKANSLLQRHFGYSILKSFQMEALGTWFSYQDCLVLAATGSGIIYLVFIFPLCVYVMCINCLVAFNTYMFAVGKSLCFQLPALLTGKVVVVISPLISLMHDQCLKLAKHGISACFLGSGQTDNSVEKKAMNGMYSIIYVCPETLLR